MRASIVADARFLCQRTGGAERLLWRYITLLVIRNFIDAVVED